MTKLEAPHGIFMMHTCMKAQSQHLLVRQYVISEINVNSYRCVAQLVRTFASHPCFLFLAPAVNRGGQTPLDLLQSYNTSSLSTRLQITAPIGLTQGYLTRLFSLIPGLEYCDLNETTGKSFIITIPTGHFSVLKQ